jgi:hypothetical protein
MQFNIALNSNTKVLYKVKYVINRSKLYKNNSYPCEAEPFLSQLLSLLTTTPPSLSAQFSGKPAK